MICSLIYVCCNLFGDIYIYTTRPWENKFKMALVSSEIYTNCAVLVLLISKNYVWWPEMKLSGLCHIVVLTQLPKVQTHVKMVLCLYCWSLCNKCARQHWNFLIWQGKDINGNIYRLRWENYTILQHEFEFS